MNGLILIISTENKQFEKTPISWKKPFDFQHQHFHRSCLEKTYQIEQFSSIKFESEKHWIETDEFFFVSEGIIQNINELCKANNVDNVNQLITKFHKNNNKTFFKDFEGNYIGLYLDKKNKTWTSFNNKTGMKKLFFFQNQDFVVLSSDLKILIQCLSFHHIPYSLNEASSYLLLTSGFMHENMTLVNEVKQLRAGEYAFISDNKLQINSYYNLKDIEQTNDSKSTIIETLDYKFKEAVKLEFELDLKHNYRHLSTLSGGLDSRMTTLIAHKMGYNDQLLLNFSEKGYADEIIAKDIAAKYNIELKHEELNAKSLLPIDKVVSVNDGLNIYTSCSHVFSILSKINQPTNGILHTGMIGDAVMGSFISRIRESEPSISSGLYSKGLINKTIGILKQSISNYPTEELYKFYNRAFLGANNGFLFFDLLGESSSPFLNSSFLSYAYSIPRKLKFHERVYIDWIKTLHPEIAKFTWECIGGKPTNNEFRRKIYRCRRAVVKRLPIKTMWKNNMNPEQLWYENDPIVKVTLDSYFDSHIDLLSGYLELRNDVFKLYLTGNITEKTQALTLLSAYKLLFNE